MTPISCHGTVTPAIAISCAVWPFRSETNSMPFYRDHIYPQLVKAMGDPKPIRNVRERIVPMAQGRSWRSLSVRVSTLSTTTPAGSPRSMRWSRMQG